MSVCHMRHPALLLLAEKPPDGGFDALLLGMLVEGVLAAGDTTQGAGLRLQRRHGPAGAHRTHGSSIQGQRSVTRLSLEGSFLFGIFIRNLLGKKTSILEAGSLVHQSILPPHFFFSLYIILKVFAAFPRLHFFF